MQALAEKIFNDPSKSLESKVQILKTILTKLPTAEGKYSLIKGCLDYLQIQPEVSSCITVFKL